MNESFIIIALAVSHLCPSSPLRNRHHSHPHVPLVHYDAVIVRDLACRRWPSVCCSRWTPFPRPLATRPLMQAAEDLSDGLYLGSSLYPSSLIATPVSNIQNALVVHRHVDVVHYDSKKILRIMIVFPGHFETQNHLAIASTTVYLMKQRL